MKSFYCFLLFSLCLVTLAGCTKSFKTTEAFEQFLNSEDYPYQKTEIKNGVKVSVKYMTPEAMTLTSLKQFNESKIQVETDTTLTGQQKDERLTELKKELDQSKEAYSKSVYFMVTIGYEDGKRDIEYEPMQQGFNVYSEWLQKLLFRMKEYITLETELLPEVPIDIYQMDRTYGLTKDRKFLLVFADQFNEVKLMDEKNKYLKLNISEFGLKTGKLSFRFELPMTDFEVKE